MSAAGTNSLTTLFALILLCSCELTRAQNYIVWGQTTNGIGAGIDGSALDTGMIFVFVHRYGKLISTTNTSYSVIFPLGGGRIDDKALDGPPFWGPTNSFCGPIELNDSNGRIMPLLIPEVSDLQFYPDHFSFLNLNKSWEQYLSHHLFISPPPLPGSHPPDFLCSPSHAYQLNSFFFTNYFNLEVPGKYRLTVWPKLYEQSSTNQDIYQRIDVPPVTVTINWTSGPQK